MPAIARPETCVHHRGSVHQRPTRPTLVVAYGNVRPSPEQAPEHAADVGPDLDPSGSRDGIRQSVTVSELRELLAKLPDDVVLCVGIRDTAHFNSFLGTLPVSAVRLEPCADAAGHVLEMEVPGIT